MIKTNLIIIVHCLFGAMVDQTAASTTENCTTWPSDLKSLAECCDIPDSIAYNIEVLCEEGCAARKNYKGGHMKCVLDCYVGEGTELMKNGRLNTATAAALYESNDYTRGSWKKAIELGVVSCHFESNGTLKESLAKYFDCVDEYLTERCIQFKSDDECFKVFNHVEDCKSQVDCSKWPENLTFSSNCCKMPFLSSDISSTCASRCAKKELLPIPQNNCGRLCDSMETDLMTSDGNINFKKVLEAMQKSEDYSEKWKQPIDNAIESCKAEVKG